MCSDFKTIRMTLGLMILGCATSGCLGETVSFSYSGSLVAPGAATYSAQWTGDGESSRAHLSWAPAVDVFGARVTRYRIHRYSTISDCPDADAVLRIGSLLEAGALVVTADAVSFEDAPDTSFNHCYVIRGLAPSGEDDKSKTVVSLHALGRITLAGFASATAGSIVSIAWEFSSSTSTTADRFLVQYSLDGGQSWTDIGEVAALGAPLADQAFSQTWTVPNEASDRTLVRVIYRSVSTGASVVAMSDPFSIGS